MIINCDEFWLLWRKFSHAQEYIGAHKTYITLQHLIECPENHYDHIDNLGFKRALRTARLTLPPLLIVLDDRQLHSLTQRELNRYAKRATCQILQWLENREISHRIM